MAVLFCKNACIASDQHCYPPEETETFLLGFHKSEDETIWEVMLGQGRKFVVDKLSRDSDRIYRQLKKKLPPAIQYKCPSSCNSIFS